MRVHLINHLHQIRFGILLPLSLAVSAAATGFGVPVQMPSTIGWVSGWVKAAPRSSTGMPTASSICSSASVQ